MQLGLDENGIRMLQHQLNQQRMQGGSDQDYGEENNMYGDEDHDQEGEEMAQMLQGVDGKQQSDSKQPDQAQEDAPEGALEEMMGEGEDFDEEMAMKLAQLNEQDGDEDQQLIQNEYGEEAEAEGEDDEDQLIDIDNLNDKEKAILMQYL